MLPLRRRGSAPQGLGARQGVGDRRRREAGQAGPRPISPPAPAFCFSPEPVIPSARGRAGGPRARSRSGARLIRLLPAPSTLPRREPGFAPRHQVNSRPPASSETPDGGRARTRAFETECDDGVWGGGGCEHLSRLRGRREAPWAGAGGSDAPLCFPKATLPAARILCQADASVWLQGLGWGWFLLRRKRVVNRPTVTVTGIVDADPNALPGPRHDRGGGAVCPCASPATPSCSPAAALAPCPARLRAAPPPVTRPHHPAPAWRDSRPSGTEPAARDGPSGRSCPPPRKGVNKEQETARRDAAVLGPGGKAGRCRSPHSLAPGVHQVSQG